MLLPDVVGVLHHLGVVDVVEEDLCELHLVDLQVVVGEGEDVVLVVQPHQGVQYLHDGAVQGLQDEVPAGETRLSAIKTGSGRPSSPHVDAPYPQDPRQQQKNFPAKKLCENWAWRWAKKTAGWTRPNKTWYFENQGRKSAYCADR